MATLLKTLCRDEAPALHGVDRSFVERGKTAAGLHTDVCGPAAGQDPHLQFNDPLPAAPTRKRRIVGRRIVEVSGLIARWKNRRAWRASRCPFRCSGRGSSCGYRGASCHGWAGGFGNRLGENRMADFRCRIASGGRRLLAPGGCRLRLDWRGTGRCCLQCNLQRQGGGCLTRTSAPESGRSAQRVRASRRQRAAAWLACPVRISSSYSDQQAGQQGKLDDFDARAKAVAGHPAELFQQPAAMRQITSGAASNGNATNSESTASSASHSARARLGTLSLMRAPL